MNFNMNKSKINIKDGHIIGIILTLSILLPHVSVLYLFNPIILIYLALKYSKIKRINYLQISMIILIFISFIWNLLYGVELSNKSLLRAFYISELILFFPFVSNIRIPNSYLYLIISVILMSQLSYILNVGFLINLFNSIYPYTGEELYYTSSYLIEKSSTISSISDFGLIRYGGLFYNSNVCMKYVSLILIVFVIENKGVYFKKHMIFYTLVIISSILASSRTGFVIILFAVILGYYLKNNKLNFKNIFFIFSFSLLLLLLLYVSFGDEIRLFQISEGFEEEGSISLKYNNFIYYWNKIYDLRQVIVGNFNIDSLKELYDTPFSMFDSEWGNSVYCYGIFFTLFYIAFLIKKIKNLKGMNFIAVLILLWIISSTILFSYRTSFAFLFVLSKYVNVYIDYNYSRILNNKYGVTNSLNNNINLLSQQS